MSSITTGTVATVVGAILLAGCSDGDAGGPGRGTADDSSYCEAVTGLPALLADLEASESFDSFGAATETLVEEAPAEVADEWERVQDAYAEMSDKLDGAGLSVGEVTTFALTPAQEEALAGIQGDLVALGQEIDAAGAAIIEHAGAACGTDPEPAAPST